MANATTLSLGLDLAGTPLDQNHPELVDFTPAAELLPFVGREVVPLPVTGNLADPSEAAITGVVAQHLEGPIEDGHEVMFQTDPPKLQYQSLIATLRSRSGSYTAT